MRLYKNIEIPKHIFKRVCKNILFPIFSYYIIEERFL